MSNRTHYIFYWAGTLLLGITSFLFWWKGHPEALSWHEQNQMFLMRSDYLMERIAVPGGVADWMSEGLTQFYYYASVGATIIAVLTMLVQVLTYLAIRHSALQPKDDKSHWSGWALSFLPALLLWYAMGDENVLLSYAVSLALVLSGYLLCHKTPWYIQTLAALLLYWIAGPLYLIAIALIIIDEVGRHKASRALVEGVILLAVAGGWFYLCRTLWVAQYPWNTIMAGINYHRLCRMTCEVPTILYVTAGVMMLLPLAGRLLRPLTSRTAIDAIVAAVLLSGSVGWFYQSIPSNYDPNTYAMLEQQYLVRRGDWRQIIETAKQNEQQRLPIIETPEYTTALNLALAKTGMIGHMFEFRQNGLQGLITPWKRNNISCVNSMEIFWELGFINESLRYAFDLQESNLCCRKSARYTKRLAECNILNGRYEVASKYIDQLKHTLFYSKWAEQAESYLYNDEKIEAYGEWGLKRQCRLEEDFLYYYPEMHKMLGMLVLKNRENTLAYDYFMASLLLSGHMQSYVANLPQPPKAGQNPFPKGYSQYLELMKRQPAADAITSASIYK